MTVNSQSAKVLWSPPPDRLQAAHLTRFRAFAAARAGQEFDNYEALHRWSTTELAEFWRAVWDFCEIEFEGEIVAVLEEPKMPGARWFRGAQLNYAANLLRGPGDTPAIYFRCELDDLARDVTFGELRKSVARVAKGLARLGVGPGDRVAAFTPNVPEAVVAKLATAALGAIWSSCSPDFGPQGVLDRFGQIEPKVLFSADGYVYRGKHHALSDRLKWLVARLPSLQTLVVYPYAGPTVTAVDKLLAWDQLCASANDADKNDVDKPEFHLAPFDHPLAILYTSGTTGVPKCILHGAGGTLLKHREEHRLQVDLQAGDVFFYFTTCGWMMWNWLLSGLAENATIVLYDGHPLHPNPGRLFRLAEELQISVFGCSPGFLAAVEKSGVRPRETHALPELRTLLSTGAPLHPSQYDWVYGSLKKDVQLISISGGTDLVGCFVGGSPFHAVRRGEIACRILGMQVESFSAAGQPVADEKGELVCTAPFPSMPLRFWNDPTGEKYHQAYFARFPGCWHHGDFVEFRPDGAAVIHGRSDSTLNPGGVRIGTSELYRAVETLAEVADSMAVGRQVDGAERIVLFVVPSPNCELDDALRAKIRSTIRELVSPRHVPAEIHSVADLPRTVSGKKVEAAVAAMMRGETPANLAALANPEALDAFAHFAEAGEAKPRVAPGDES